MEKFGKHDGNRKVFSLFPHRNKLAPIRYLQLAHGIPESRVFVAGDNMNDFETFSVPHFRKYAYAQSVIGKFLSKISTDMTTIPCSRPLLLLNRLISDVQSLHAEDFTAT